MLLNRHHLTGTEFVNSLFDGFCKANNINHVVTSGHSEKAEIQMRSMKNVIARIFTANGGRNLPTADVIQQAADIINSSYSRSLGMTPLEASAEDSAPQVLKRRVIAEYKRDDKLVGRSGGNILKKPEFKEGELVRIRLPSRNFSKENYRVFSEKLYRITHVNPSFPVPSYKVFDLAAGFELPQTFTSAELLRAESGALKNRRIERVHRVFKPPTGEEMGEVSYKGWGNDYRETIPSASINYYQSSFPRTTSTP